MEGMIAMVGISEMIGMMEKEEPEITKDCLGDNCDKEFTGTFAFLLLLSFYQSYK